MAKSWDYGEGKKNIVIEPPKQTLRITGHRMASVLGLNKYQSAFGAWAEITKLVKLPFEDTKYTLAGKAIEPKQIEYIATKLPNIVPIKEYYGNSFEEYQYNNFKDDSNIFGGVMDAVSTLNDKKTITAIVECKTSSKPQEWTNENVPVEYLLQGAEYAKLKGIDRIIFVCSFLKDEDYNHPETFNVNDENTIIVIKKLSDILVEINNYYCNIDDLFSIATDWWNNYVETGISPQFDEKVDKEYLDIIRAMDATKDEELEDVCAKAFDLNLKIKELKYTVGIDDLEKQLKNYETAIKSKMIENDLASCGNYKLKKTIKCKFDETLFKKEHEDLYIQYSEETESYTLTKNNQKEED